MSYLASNQHNFTWKEPMPFRLCIRVRAPLRLEVVLMQNGSVIYFGSGTEGRLPYRPRPSSRFEDERWHGLEAHLMGKGCEMLTFSICFFQASQ